MIKTLIKAEHWSVLERWPSAAKPDEIKGLKLMKSIVKHQGTKRFRTKHVEKDDKAVFLSEQINVEEAQERLKKKYNMSAYSAEFGASAPPKEAAETVVLGYKKYSELPLAVMLNDTAKKYLDTWLSLNDLEVYKASVLTALRSLFSLIKTQSVSKSCYSGQFQYNKALVVPTERIDKRLFAKTSVPVKPAGASHAKPAEPEHAVAEQQLCRIHGAGKKPRGARPVDRSPAQPV